MATCISILGSSGKMGQRILNLATTDSRFKVVGQTRKNSCLQTALSNCSVAIDFSHKDVAVQHIETAAALGKALVIGTTGLEPEALHVMQIAAKKIPILYSPNFSLGIALCLETATRFSRALEGKCTIDVYETHHVHKKDSPSGTALALAKAAGESVNIHSKREGEIIGEHTIVFSCPKETIEIKHIAHSRDLFAEGALIAAAYLKNKAPGLYSLKDLFD